MQLLKKLKCGQLRYKSLMKGRARESLQKTNKNTGPRHYIWWRYKKLCKPVSSFPYLLGISHIC
ncbi:hypothetical protein H5410_036212 [Solanum commersonii]|uniref:Uncharacterized protein n=1 Tax=Solanum commersonii TaxID=4109 RepID=A0A9J5Y6V8_SOLCO|nr:hypothetical protein H5410_036212 [Solanum commersonii]